MSFQLKYSFTEGEEIINWLSNPHINLLPTPTDTPTFAFLIFLNLSVGPTAVGFVYKDGEQTGIRYELFIKSSTDVLLLKTIAKGQVVQQKNLSADVQKTHMSLTGPLMTVLNTTRLELNT